MIDASAARARCPGAPLSGRFASTVGANERSVGTHLAHQASRTEGWIGLVGHAEVVGGAAHPGNAPHLPRRIADHELPSASIDITLGGEQHS
jgi:hypothetical protein